MAQHAPHQQQIIQLFSHKLQVDVPTVNTDLIDAGLLDSLAFVELIAHLEQLIGSEISVVDLELDEFRSVSRIAEFVSRHQEPSLQTESTFVESQIEGSQSNDPSYRQ